MFKTIRKFKNYHLVFTVKEMILLSLIKYKLRFCYIVFDKILNTDPS
jgi:hypothetical protein